MNEAQTSYEYIEPALKKAGWGDVEDSRVRKEFLTIKAVYLVRVEKVNL